LRSWCAIYDEFSHRYDERNAHCFTWSEVERIPVTEAIRYAFSHDPVACLPFDRKKDSSPKSPKPPTPAMASYRQRRLVAHVAEIQFWQAELKAATAAKFLPTLRAEKAKTDAPPGTRKTTWIFVHYKNKTLNLGVFEWVVGNKQPYVSFKKAKHPHGFYL
jgi:hypothetical protein